MPSKATTDLGNVESRAVRLCYRPLQSGYRPLQSEPSGLHTTLWSPHHPLGCTPPSEGTLSSVSSSRRAPSARATVPRALAHIALPHMLHTYHVCYPHTMCVLPHM